MKIIFFLQILQVKFYSDSRSNIVDNYENYKLQYLLIPKKIENAKIWQRKNWDFAGID